MKKIETGAPIPLKTVRVGRFDRDTEHSCDDFGNDTVFDHIDFVGEESYESLESIIAPFKGRDVRLTIEEIVEPDPKADGTTRCGRRVVKVGKLSKNYDCMCDDDGYETVVGAGFDINTGGRVESIEAILDDFDEMAVRIVVEEVCSSAPVTVELSAETHAAVRELIARCGFGCEDEAIMAALGYAIQEGM